MLVVLAQHPALAQQPVPAPSTAKSDTARSDPEYDRYRLKGDEAIKAGMYRDARSQYRNCLEVPGFEQDTYAANRIDLASKCLSLLQQADDAVQQQKTAEMVNRLTDVLALNPTDPIVKNRLADFYLAEGNQLFQQKRYAEAKEQYQRGVPFAQGAGNRTMMSTLDLQIRNSDVRLNEPVIRYVTPKRTVAKIALGVLALGAGYYAYTLQTDFTATKDALTLAAASADPDGDGLVNLPDDFQRYNAAYTAAAAAQDKRGLYVACVSVASAATLTELYLLLKKAKPRPATGFFWKPTSTSYGLAVGYRF